MKLMEVRCCCKPQKLLGYLPAPAKGVRIGIFIIPPRLPSSESHRVGALNPGAPVVFVPAQTIRLSVEMFNEFLKYGESVWDVEKRISPAYKAEDVPIETLRQIPEFLELKP